ncbi:MAG: protein kinase [Planctomycetes bacterium]|nr:protein kinase [Planctomycetota bacterium]
MNNEGEPLPEQASEAFPAPPDALARREDPALALPTGTGLGKYRILERIRTYHNAVVYKARDTMLDRLVALKQMTPELMDSPTACGNFKKEAQLLARVPKDARYVLNVHELIEDERGLFIVEEYIHGDWLESLISKRRVGIEHTYKLLKSAIIGLRDLHAQKIVHRDLNPGNIMVVNGAAKIANFYSAAQEGDIVSPPVVTVKYSAPELLLEKSYDDRIDLYSLGMVLYEVSVGRAAIDRYFHEIVDSRMPISGWYRWHTDLSTRLPEPERLNPAVPPPLSMILRQLTAKRLEERFTCAEEVLAAISRHSRKAARPKAAPATRWTLPAERATTVQPPRIQPAPRADAPGARTTPEPTYRPIPAGTHTQNVRPAAWRATDYDAPASTTPFERVSPFRSPRAEMPRSRVTAPTAVPRVMPAPIIPRASRKPRARRGHPIRNAILAATVMICIGVGGFVGWREISRSLYEHPVEALMIRGEQSFDQGDMTRARQLFREASDLVGDNRDQRRHRAEAQHWMQLIDAVAALNADEFDRAFQITMDLEKYGDINPSKLKEVQAKIWSKKDAYKIAAAGYDGIKSGQFERVEKTLEQFEQSAKGSGLDPDSLRDKLSEGRRRKEYDEWMKASREALRTKEFDKAFTMLARAEDFQVTSDTRDLRKQITDAQRQREFLVQGDKALIDRDYEAALDAYEQANLKLPGAEIEKKVREARAHLLFQQARALIDKGELLLAEDKLNSSIWNHPLYDAQIRLQKMQPAFEAARIARNGDRAMDIEHWAEAIQFYEDAILRLPAPADQIAMKKLKEARRRDAIAKGERAIKREEWQAAVEFLTEAQRLGYDQAVEDNLIRAKAKVP